MAELPSGRVVGGNSYVEQLLRHPVHYSADIDSYDEWVAFHADGTRVESREYPLARMVLGGEESPSIDVNYRRGDGTFAWTRISGRPVRNAAGELAGGVVALVDIDEERKARDRSAEQLETMRNQLVHASRVSAMGTMASTIAHEVNQPLTAVASCLRGTINRLKRGGVESIDEAVRWLSRAEQITLQAGETIQRLRAMLARSEPKRQKVALVGLIEDANAIALVGTAAAGIEYSQDVEPGLMVDADPVQVQQVLINLVRNAVEAVDRRAERRVVLSARREDGFVHLCVEDSGPGIADDARDTLFEPFVSSKANGMGVGLSICRTIVEAHGGRISAGKGKQGGAALCFTIPAG
jgi:two-component system sensor kinase FixL